MFFADESRYASKTGLSSLQAGFQTRYEINKNMPFVDVGYGYEKGLKQTDWQTGLTLSMVGIMDWVNT